MRIFLTALSILAFVQSPAAQFLKPVHSPDLAAAHLLAVTATVISTTECRGSTYFKNGETHNDSYSYDVSISGNLSFKNISSGPVLLYKSFDPSLTQRVAGSQPDLVAGKFVGGFDGDRMAIAADKPLSVSIADFAVIKPGEAYSAAFRTTVFAITGQGKPLYLPGKYWIQLGIDARPDALYFGGQAASEFKRKSRSAGTIVDFLLAEPFPVDIQLRPDAPACKSE